MARTFLPLEDVRVSSISELRDLKPQNKHVVTTEGQSSPADGKSNVFWWDPSGDPSNADGESIVASNLESSGTWRRVVAPAARTSDEVNEGSSNLFYTDERVDDRVNSLLTEGNGVTLTYDDASGSLTIAASDVTAEDVQDDAWDVLTGTQSLISVTYDDANDEVDFTVEPGLSNYTNDAGFVTDLTSFDTGDLSEGTNLYYTDERVDDRVNNLTTGGTHVTTTYDDGNNTLTFDVDDNLSSYNNDTGYITDLTSFTTDDLSEGASNLYYTDERVDDRVNSLLSAGNGITLNYDDAGNTLTITSGGATTEEIQDDAWDVLTGTQSLINVSYDDANDEVDFTVEPSLSNYTNDAGFVTGLGGFTTDDLTEGSTNLYFSDERVDDRVNQLLQEGNGVTLTYDDASGSLTIAASDVTAEDIQDDAWNVLTGSQTLINVTYDDANDEVGFVVESDLSNYSFTNVSSDEISEGSSNLYFSEERVDDRVDALLAGGTHISATYDDGAGSLTVSADDNLSAYTNDAGFITGLSGFTTDDLREGSLNLYFSEERVDDRVDSLLSAGNGISLTYDDASGSLTIASSGVSTEEIQDDAWDVLTGTQTLVNVTYDDANDEVDFVVESDLSNYSFSNVTSDKISEGSSNLYFTDERVDDRVNSLLTAGNGITLSYDDASGSLTITSSEATTEEIQDDAWSVLTGTQSLISVTYDDLNDEVDFTVESDLSNYSFSNVTTDVLAEGSSNLYFTEERVDDRIDGLLTGGSNVTLNYDDPADTFTITAADTQLSSEEVQDAVYNNVLSGTQTLISVTYDDANNEVSFVVENDLSNYDFSSVTTDNITEGSSNLYYTDARVDSEVRRISPTNQATFDGGSSQYTIPHGLGEIPQSWHITPVSADAANFSHVDANATNLIVNYSSNTPAGSQNVVLNWTAEASI